MKNTAITYMYRDGDNYKACATAVFAGVLSIDQKATLLAGLDDPESSETGFFIPGQVGLKDLQNSFHDQPRAVIEAALVGETDPHLIGEIEAQLGELDKNPCRWDPESDHVWHDLIDIEPTDKEPTDERSIEAFVSEMSAAEWDASYEPPFYDEMVRNQEAYLERNNSEDLDCENSDKSDLEDTDTLEM
jgi:hypothetical protein